MASQRGAGQGSEVRKSPELLFVLPSCPSISLKSTHSFTHLPYTHPSSTHLSIHPPFLPPFHPSIHLPTHLPTHLPSKHLPIQPPFHCRLSLPSASSHPSTLASTYPSVHFSVPFTFCLSVLPFICLSIILNSICPSITHLFF